MKYFLIKTIFFLLFFSSFESFGQQTGLGAGINFYPLKIVKSITAIDTSFITNKTYSHKVAAIFHLERFKIINAENKRRNFFLSAGYQKFVQINGKIEGVKNSRTFVTADETVMRFSSNLGFDFLKKRKKLSNEKLSVWSGWTYRLPFSSAKNSYTDTQFFRRDAYRLGLNIAYKATVSYPIGKESFIELCIIPPLQFEMGMNYSIYNDPSLPLSSREQLNPTFDLKFRPELQLGIRFILQEKEEKRKKQ